MVKLEYPKRYKIHFFTTALALILFSSLTVTTQTTSIETQITGVFSSYRDVSWSSDGRYFTFFSTSDLPLTSNEKLEGVDLTVDAWWKYDLLTSELSNQSRWPLQPVLTEEQFSAWQPQGFIYLSHNNDLALFSNLNNQFIVGNLQTGQVKAIDQEGYSYSPSNFSVAWNANNDSVVTERLSLGLSSLIFYAHIPQPEDVSSIVTYEFESIHGVPYIVFPQEGDKIHDLSPSGEFVLLSAREHIPELPVYESPTRVILWNPLEENNSLVFSTELFQPYLIETAAFSPNDSTRLILLHRSLGLLEYDYNTGQSRVLIEELTETDGWFSPDARWLAVNVDGHFRLVDLTELVPEETSLQLTSICSNKPELIRIWQIKNTTSSPINITWSVINTDQSGSGTVLGGTIETPGEFTFQTQTVHDSSNIVRVTVDGEQPYLYDANPSICG